MSHPVVQPKITSKPFFLKIHVFFRYLNAEDVISVPPGGSQAKQREQKTSRSAAGSWESPC